MATTSISLGAEFEKFIKAEVQSGRFATVTEVIRDALRDKMEGQRKKEQLFAILEEGIAQADRGEFAENWDTKSVMARARSRVSGRKAA